MLHCMIINLWPLWPIFEPLQETTPLRLDWGPEPTEIQNRTPNSQKARALRPGSGPRTGSTRRSDFAWWGHTKDYRLTYWGWYGMIMMIMMIMKSLIFGMYIPVIGIQLPFSSWNIMVFMVNKPIISLCSNSHGWLKPLLIGEWDSLKGFWSATAKAFEHCSFSPNNSLNRRWNGKHLFEDYTPQKIT